MPAYLYKQLLKHHKTVLYCFICFLCAYVFLVTLPKLKDSNAKINRMISFIDQYHEDINQHNNTQKIADNIIKLVEKTGELKEIQLFSWLIPATWIEFNTKEKIVVIACNAIMESMKIIFEYKYQQLQADNKDAYIISNTSKFITQLNQYKELNNYINILINIDTYKNQYNEIIDSGRIDLVQLNEIIKFLFEKHLEEQFINKYKAYFNNEITLIYQKMNIKKFPSIGKLKNFEINNKQIQKICLLYAEKFTQKWFENNVLFGLLNKLTTHLQILDEKQRLKTRFKDLNYTKNVLEVIKKCKSLLLQEDYVFISETPDVKSIKPLNTILSAINETRILYPIKDTIHNEWNKGCNKFIKRLKEYKVKIENYDIYLVDINKKSLSKPVLQLNHFFNEIKNCKIYSDISQQPSRSSNDSSRWSKIILENAEENCQSFLALKNYNFPKNQLFLFLQKVILNSIKNHFDDCLSKQIKNCVSQDRTVFYEISNSQVSNNFQSFYDNIELIALLIKNLKLLELDSYDLLKNILVRETNYFIDQVYELINHPNEDIFIGNFDSWSGQSGASLIAFDRLNIDSLKDLFTRRIKRINTLADKYVKPLFNFWKNEGVRLTDHHFNTSIKKWKIIIDQLTLFGDNAKSSVRDIENFIIYELNEINIDNYSEKRSQILNTQNIEDFFIQRKNDLLVQVIKKCDSLLKTKAQDDYSKIAKAFSDNLYGKFPFSISDISTSCEEVSLTNLVSFFNIFKTINVSKLKNILNNKTIFIHNNQNAIVFLKQMETVKSFFSSCFEGRETKPTISFKIQLGSDSNAVHYGENQISKWKFQVRDSDPRTKKYKEHNEIWQLGDSVRLTLQWAKNGNIYPLKNKEKRYVSYKYGGNWAFFQFLKDFNYRQNYNYYELIKQVKTRNTSSSKIEETTIFMKLYICNNSSHEICKESIPIFPPQAALLY